MKSQLFAFASIYMVRLVMPVLAAVCATTLLPYIGFVVCLGIPMSEFESWRYHLPFVGSLFVFSGAWVIQLHEDLSTTLMVKPLGHRLLFFWLVIVPMLVLIGGLALATGFVEFIYKANWPVIRPILYYLAASSLVAACRFLPAKRPPSQVFAFFLGGSATILICGSTGYFPQGLEAPLEPQAPFQTAELITLPVLSLFCLGVAYSSLVAHRSGQREFSLGFTIRKEVQETDPARRSFAGFPSAIGATRWFHIRRMSPIVAGCLGIATASVGAQILAAMNGDEPLQVAAEFSILLSLGASVTTGLLVGYNVRLPSQPIRETMSTFLSTKPLSDRQHWLAMVQAVSVLAVVNSLLMVLIGLAAPIAWNLSVAERALRWPTSFQSLADHLGGEEYAMLAWVLFLFITHVTMSCLFAALVLVGRDKLLSRAVGIGMTLTTVLFFGSQLLSRTISTAIQSQLTHLFFGLAAIAATGVAVWTFYQSVQHKLLRMHEVAVALLLWLGISWAFSVTTIGPSSTVYAAIDGALLLLLVMGVAAAPLALRFSRHR